MKIIKQSIAQINSMKIRNAGSAFKKVKILLDKMEETSIVANEHLKKPSKFVGQAIKKLNIF